MKEQSRQLRKGISILLGLLMALSFQSLIAQNNKYEAKQKKANRKELKKEDRDLKKEIRRRAEKKARREAGKFKKRGWYVAPGAIPMEKQIEKGWMAQYQEDQNGYPLYIVATGNSVAESQAAAKLQATELAKLELAGLVQTQIAALIENNVATNQLSNEEAASVTKTVAASKNIIAQEIQRVLVFFEIYKKIGKNTESSVRIGYNTDLAMESAKKVVRKKLEEETELMQEKLEKLMDF
ncbi:hypothetical protein [Xanthovirga aplysinae]|uniref:hypothetical protein n=1 Tax=Xanthovirga aplysinae TaxID=2529853 RepID=UPI0012BBC783|nr:hypothetical protein [Xanthovirga aplysinae]MTI32960.1 hypothetical protein [Xanthovirga aplysinae]